MPFGICSPKTEYEEGGGGGGRGRDMADRQNNVTYGPTHILYVSTPISRKKANRKKKDDGDVGVIPQ